ncbi:site-specific integrase [Hoeflea sp. CAU 1731]
MTENQKPIKLTKSAVDKLPVREKPYFVFDSTHKGFSVRVSPTGAKTWQVEYRPYPGGRGVKMRRIALGSNKALTPEQARDKAKAILADVAKGGDPAKDRAAKRKELTVAQLIGLYEEEGCYVLRGIRQGQPMKPTTKAYTLARLRNHVVPIIGDLRITNVAEGDIEKMVRMITAGKTAKNEKKDGRGRVIVKGGEGAARKVARDLSAVFTFAIRRKLVTENPCKNAAIRKTDNQRTRYLTMAEIQRLGEALDTLQEQGVNPKALNIARLWALTGCRRDEIAGLKWDEVDFEHSCLMLDDSKTGRSVRPLAASALALLSEIPREDESPYVFPATTGNGHFQGTKRVWPKAIELAKLPGVSPHTLRHTLGSSAISVGETMAMTGAILGHANPRSTAIYAHVQRDPAAQATARAVEPIAAALKRKSSGDVVPLKREAE